MAESLEPHEMVNLDSLGLANSIDVIAGKVHQHDVFCTVFLRSKQLLAELLVL